MLNFNDVYFGDSIKKNRKKIIRNLRYQRLLNTGLYVVYENERTNKPEVMQAVFFNEIYFAVHTIKILAIFGSKEEGIQYLINHIVNEQNAVLAEE